MDISVNLATFNRAPFLEKCLESLCQQTLDPARYEICVVNNACTDNTAEVVESIVRRYPHHRVFMVYEPVAGLSRARNCGLRATTAPLVANVDDDGTVYPDWLESYVKRFAELGEDTVIVGGEIEPIWGGPKPAWLSERMQCFLSAGTGLGPEARFLPTSECTSEGNSCYRRAALARAGNFPEQLGRAGTNLLSGESVVEALMRKQGGRVFFDPHIILRHFIHANRLTPTWFRHRFFWQGISGFAVRQYQIKHDVPVDAATNIELPLLASDWDFLNGDTPEGIAENTIRFQSLGFILALTGIIQVET